MAVSESLVQFNIICIALHHRYSLKGIIGACIYDTLLTLAPQRGRKKTPFVSCLVHYFTCQHSVVLCEI